MQCNVAYVPVCLETRPPDVAAPVCAWLARAPGMGFVGLPRPGHGFGRSAGTEIPPCGSQAQLKADGVAQWIGSLGARVGDKSRCMMEFVRRQ